MANEFVVRNGLLALDNSVISGSLTVTGGITGSFSGTGSYAAFALSSSNSLTSSFAFQAANASNAVSASFATVAANASSASYALSSSFAFQAANAASASSATNAVTASHAVNAVTASRALNANTASYVQNAASASYALSSSYALNASTATSASFASNASTAASASFATNASTAASASYATNAGNAGSASFAQTSSFVNTLNQSVIVTNVLAVGTPSITGTENTLVVGTLSTAGTGEGGQILLVASGGLYTSASMLDNYQNRFRILRGTNAGSDAELFITNLNNGQLTFNRYTGSGAFTGTAVANLSVDSSGNVITVAPGTTTSASYAVSSSYAMSASFASQAANASSASYATTASYAYFGISSSFASNAANASSASAATFASTASLAQSLTPGTVVSASNIFVNSNLTVNGTASFSYLQTVSGSAVVIGEEYIVLNTQSPISRFAGLIINDSGSNSTASIVWDSQNNHFVYTNASGSTYSGGGFMSGPRNLGALGSEAYPTLNRVLRGQGGDHLYDSNITDNDTNIILGINTQITGTLGVTGTITGNLTGTASFATSASYAGAASNATSASFATSAANATTASFATSAANATSASYALFAATATSATNATNANTASWATNVNTSSWANNATNASTASWATRAVTASFALNSQNAFVQGGNSFGATALLGTNDAQNLQFETNGTIRMTISGSNGNVGIGTTIPASGFNLTLENNGANLRLRNTTTRYRADFAMNTAQLNINSYDDTGATYMPIQLDGSTTILGTQGNVGVGTNNPLSLFHVHKAGNNAGGTILMGITTDQVSKWSYLVGTQYSSSAQPQGFTLIGGFSDLTSNRVIIGGSIYEANPSTAIEFYTHPVNNHNLGGSLRMVINASGSVGINTTTPATRLDVDGNTTIRGSLAFKAAGTNNGNLIISDNGGGTATINNSGNSFLDISAASRTTITVGDFVVSSGCVGIGTTAPVSKLQVIAADGYSSFWSNNASNYTFISIGRTSSELEFGVAAGANQFFTGTVAGDAAIKVPPNKGSLFIGATSGAPAMVISQSNSIGIGTTTTSYKLEVFGDRSRFYNVAIGGLLGSGYAAYSDSVIGVNNLHLSATGSGAVYINTLVALPTYINPVGGNVGIGTVSSLTGKLNFPDSDYGEGINFYPSATVTNRTGIGKYLQELRSYIPSDDRFTWYSGGPGGSEIVRFTGGGSVGINTTAPISRLDISSDGATNNQFIRLRNTEAGHNRTWMLGVITASSGSFRIYDVTTGNDRFVISGSGNVGIGTTTPTYKFQVSDGTRVVGFDFTQSLYPVIRATTVLRVYQRTEFWGSSDGYYIDVRDASGNQGVYLSGSGTSYFNGGNLGIGTTTPERKVVIVGPSSTQGDQSGTLVITDGTGANTDHKLQFGISSNSFAWIQSVKPGTNTLPLILQPQGSNVGIGTATPRAALDLGSANNRGQVILLGETGANNRVGFGLDSGTAGMRIFTVNNSSQFIDLGGISTTDGTSWTRNHRFGIAGGNTSLHEQGGNVGIGTTAPNGAKLHAYDSSGAIYLRLETSGSTAESTFYIANRQGYALIGLSGADGNIITGTSAGDLNINNRTGGRINLSTNSTAAQLTISGSVVGIGTINGISGNSRMQLLIGGNANGSTLALGNNGNSNKFVIESDSGENALINNKSATPMIFYTSGSRRMDIASDGNVGINTTVPTHKVHIRTTDDNTYALRVQGSTGNVAGDWTGIGIAGEEANTKAAIIFEDIGVSYSRGKLHLAVNNTLDQSNATKTDARLTVTNDGNVGIGNTSPQQKLTVQGGVNNVWAFSTDTGDQPGFVAGNNTEFSTSTQILYCKLYGTALTGTIFGNTIGGKAILAADGSVNTGLIVGTFNAQPLIIGANNSEVIRVTTGSNVGIGTTAPAYKLEVNGVAAFGTTTRTEIGNAASDPAAAGISYGIFHNSGIGLGIASGAGSTTQGIAFWSHNGTSFFRSMLIAGGNGNVGIGTANPRDTLEVCTQGNIRASRPTSDQYTQLYYAGLINSGNNDLYLTSAANNGIIFNTNGANEKMRITSAGNVGIGTTNPIGAFTVGGESGSIASHIVSWGQSERYERKRGATFASGLIYKSYNKSSTTLFPSPPTEADFTSGIRNYSGTVRGIGVTANISTFAITGDYYYVEFFGLIYVDTAKVYYFKCNSDDASDVFVDGKRVADYYGGHGPTNGGINGSIYLNQGYHKFYARFEEQGGGDELTVSWSTDGGSTYVTIPSSVFYHDPNDIIRSDGSANAYFLADVVAYSTSDIRLKENITPIETPLEKVMKLQGVDFTWKQDIDTEYAGKKDIGLIAQQVEEVLPDAVETRYNGYKAVRYEKVIPLLVESIKEQQKQIDELKYLLQTQNK